MRFLTSVLASVATLSLVSAQDGYKGFNYGAQFMDDSAKQQNDFEYEFNAAKQLAGTNGEWTSARLYTMIQHGTTNSVIQAIQAAINTKTSLLLGLWASVPPEQFNNEIAALKAAIDQYGSAFADLVVGISVGSEDLYRITPTGIENKSGVGASPDQLISYIKQTRAAIEGTGLAGKPVGHVDTWTAYINGSNNGVIAELDFLGMNGFPYFQTTMANSIENANATFYDSLDATVGASQGKPVWVTETGWPVSGDQENQAVASIQNAATYWKEVTCSLLAAKVNFWYYTFQDAQMGTPSPSFGIKPAGDLAQSDVLFDLSCPASAKPATRLVDWLARANGQAKSPPRSSSTRTWLSTTSITPVPISPPPTTSTPIVTTPITSNLTSLTAGPPLPVPTDLDLLFQVPQLLVPIDHWMPDNAVGSQFIGQLSPQFSTLVNFIIPASYSGKTCDIVFYMPPKQSGWWAPYQLNSPGGVSVARLDQPASEKSTANNKGPTKPLGIVGSLTLGQGHVVGRSPCETGKTVGYDISPLAGLDLQFYQSVNPPVGLFLHATG